MPKLFGLRFKKGNADMLHFITHQSKKNEMVHCSPLIYSWHSVLFIKINLPLP